MQLKVNIFLVCLSGSRIFCLIRLIFSDKAAELKHDAQGKATELAHAAQGIHCHFLLFLLSICVIR